MLGQTPSYNGVEVCGELRITGIARADGSKPAINGGWDGSALTCAGRLGRLFYGGMCSHMFQGAQCSVFDADGAGDVLELTGLRLTGGCDWTTVHVGPRAGACD